MPTLLRFTTLLGGVVTRYVEIDPVSFTGWAWYAHTHDGPLKGRRCTVTPYQITGRHDFSWCATRWLQGNEAIMPYWPAHVICDDGEIAEAGHADGLVQTWPTTREPTAQLQPGKDGAVAPV